MLDMLEKWLPYAEKGSVWGGTVVITGASWVHKGDQPMPEMWWIGVGLVTVAAICWLFLRLIKAEIKPERKALEAERLVLFRQQREMRLNAFVHQWSDRAALGGGIPPDEVAQRMHLELLGILDDPPQPNP